MLTPTPYGDLQETGLKPNTSQKALGQWGIIKSYLRAQVPPIIIETPSSMFHMAGLSSLHNFQPWRHIIGLCNWCLRQ